MIRRIALLLPLLFTLSAQAAPIDNKDGFWSEWSDATFAKAAAEKKFVIVSLQSWWCPWCHVMNRETWANPDVRGVLKDKFIPVYVDQDSRPDISQRYERWGWPATIIFGPDGTEIVKLRGFYSPQFFIPILTATIDDPSPVDYPTPGGAERDRTLATGLTDAQRDEILGLHRQGLGRRAMAAGARRKLVDGPTLVWFLERARQGDAANAARIRKVLTLMASDLIDKTGAHQPGLAEARLVGAVARIPDVRAAGRAGGLCARLGDVRRSRLPAGRRSHLRLPQRHDGRARRRLLRLHGHGRGRARRRQAPYARETARRSRACSPITTRPARRRRAISRSRAARWALRQPRAAGRRLPPRRTGHGRALPRRQCRDGQGAAGAASLDRRARMADAARRRPPTSSPRPSSIPRPAASSPRPRPTRSTCQSRSSSARTTSRRRASSPCCRPTPASASYREIAEAGMGYLASPPVLEAFGFLPDVLLAEDELRNEPVHVTIVGAKDDPRTARALSRGAGLSARQQARRMVGQARRQRSPIPTSTIRTIPTARRPSPAPATSAPTRHRARDDRRPAR